VEEKPKGGGDIFRRSKLMKDVLRFLRIFNYKIYGGKNNE